MALIDLEFFVHDLIMPKYLNEMSGLGIKVILYQAKHCKGAETSTILLFLEEIISMSD